MDTQTETTSKESNTTSEPPEQQTEWLGLSEKQFAYWWIEYMHKKGLTYEQIVKIASKARRLAEGEIKKEDHRNRRSNR